MAEKVINERGLQNGDKIRWILSHPSWNKPISSKLITINGKLNSEITSNLSGFVEYKEVPISEVKFEIQSTKIPRGSGRLIVTKDNLKRKKSVITIKNDDSTCLARAIVTAVANINKTKWTKTQLKDGFNKSRNLQKDMTLEDVKTFANHLKIQINIVDNENFNELLFTSENEHDGQMIYLCKKGNHFDVITSMTGFLDKSYYFHTCKKSYKKRDCHRCPAKCIACFKYFPKGNKCSGKVIECSDCNRIFFGQNCFDEHKRDRKIKEDAESKIVCKKVCKCKKCGRIITYGLENHICGFSKCSNCREYCDMNEHRCFMVNKKCKGGNCVVCDEEKKCYSCKTRTDKYIFYDFETNQETGVHVVNWVDCEDFYGNKNTFETIDEFCKFVFDAKNDGFTFIAHNSKGYDAQFIRNWCIENSMKPYCIYNGRKIMSMEVSGRRFIDSLNFVAAPLASFPKTFGLTELKKGYFPHYFNKKCNQDYVGPIPSKKHFGCNRMSSYGRKAFDEWYQARVDENYVFDFKKELREYCRSDVDILRRSMLKFRNDFIELENIDPLLYITIASVCMTVYRCNYMPCGQIGVVKDATRDEKFSKISIAWLDWISERDGVNIKHALNGGEKNLTDIGKVDGFCKETKTVYEFQGCFWHGCEKCFSNDTINTKKSDGYANSQKEDTKKE